jgi:hypothetical protein
MKKESVIDGIIAGLTSEHRGNVCDRGIVAISDSIISDSTSSAPRKAGDLMNTLNHFCSKNESNQWLCYDFKDCRVQLLRSTIHPIQRVALFVSWLLKVYWMV